MFLRTGRTPRELKRKLTRRDIAELYYYVSKNPIDDQSNFHWPIASLYALLFNINRDPKTQSAITLQDALLFRERDETDDVEIGEAGGW